MVSLLRRDLFGPARYHLLNKPKPIDATSCVNPWAAFGEATIQGASRLKDRPHAGAPGPAPGCAVGGIQPTRDPLAWLAWSLDAHAASSACRYAGAKGISGGSEGSAWGTPINDAPATAKISGPSLQRSLTRAYDPRPTRGETRLIDLFA
ncbi:MAG: hypothetical protein NTW19_04670 [Planctomycetota bacterium]|nr:hypothetical protein [Planctomycetota bacterium]